MLRQELVGLRCADNSHWQWRERGISRRRGPAPENRRRPLVAPALNQHVENLALVVDGAPQVHPFASNPDHHLVEVPIARAWAAPPQISCDPGPEFQNPAPHRFIGNLQAALGQEFLNVAVAQCEPEVQPNRVLDNRGREAMASIGQLQTAYPTRCLARTPFA